MAGKHKMPDSSGQRMYELWRQVREHPGEPMELDGTEEDGRPIAGIKITGLKLDEQMREIWSIPAPSVKHTLSHLRTSLRDNALVVNLVNGRKYPEKNVHFVRDEWPESMAYQPPTKPQAEPLTHEEEGDEDDVTALADESTEGEIHEEEEADGPPVVVVGPVEDDVDELLDRLEGSLRDPVGEVRQLVKRQQEEIHTLRIMLRNAGHLLEGLAETYAQMGAQVHVYAGAISEVLRVPPVPDEGAPE